MRRVFFGSLVVVSLVAGNSAFANETAPSNEELLRRLTALENSNAKLEKENASLRSRERHREKGKQVALTEPNGRSLPVSAAASVPHSGIAAYASAPIPAAPFNWTGFYVGALSGYGWTQLTDSGPPGVPAFQPTGGFWGVQVGVNKQFASGWLIGAEFDAALARIEASSKGPNPSDPTEFLAATIKLNNLMTLRGRFGFAADQNLFYLTGGLAWSEIEISAGSGGGIGPPGPVRSSYTDKTLPGWAIGGGIERALWDNWTGKIEYLYVRLDPINQEKGVIQMDVHTIKVGVNYLFH